MSTSISKRAAGKTMRVATVFTGVVGAAVLTAPVNAQGTTFMPGRPALTAKPENTRSGLCHNTSHWFALYGYQYPDEAAPSYWCYGGVDPLGTNFALPRPFKAVAFCGGNNVGFFSGYTKSGKYRYDQRFRQSSNFYFFKAPKFPGSYFTVSQLHISAWTGNQSCFG
jgi:hypothetical protein